MTVGQYGPEVILNGNVGSPSAMATTNITIKNPDNSAAALFTTTAGTTSLGTNVVATDVFGNLTFFAAAGPYKLTYTDVTGARTLTVIVYEDTADLGTTYQAKGDPTRVGSLALPDATADPNGYVKAQTYHGTSTGMVILAQKVAGDSTNINFDGSIQVKHGKEYTGTPGYADTLQVYTLAGSDGTIIGNNDYVGATDTPSYAPTTSEVSCGYVRFELGPLWPYSERMRLNNQGDLIIGWTLVRKTTCSQSGTTITNTGADFVAADVGRFLLWGDYETGGKRAFADRITAFTSAAQVTVETSRTITSQAASVRTPKAIITKDGEVQKFAAPTTYTPSLRGSTTNPTIGTGAVQFGRYFDDGNRVRGDVRIKAGTGFVAGSGYYSVTLPVLAHADDVAQNLLVGASTFYDVSTGVTYVLGAAVLSTDSVLFYVDGSASALGAASPVVPAVGDEIRLQFDFRRA